MPTYYKVTSEVLALAREIISLYHEDLEDARIGFIFQEEAGKKLGHIVLGSTTKVSERQQAAGLDLDFIITLAHDEWELATENARRAVIDHELCHCDFNDGDCKLAAHDIEEFQVIIDRYGLWKSDLRIIAPSFSSAQLAMFPDAPQARGKVEAVEPAQLAL